MVFDCLLPLPLGPGSLGPKTSGPGQFSCPLPSRNGLPIRADGHRVHQSPDGTLLIHNLRAGDQGSYTCSTYRGSQAVSRSTEVKVVPPGRKGRCPRAGCGPRDSGPSPGSLCQFLEVCLGQRISLPKPSSPHCLTGCSEDEGNNVDRHLLIA